MMIYSSVEFNFLIDRTEGGCDTLLRSDRGQKNGEL